MFHQELEAAFQPDTSLVSVMTVNNEIGVKQPVGDIGEYSMASRGQLLSLLLPFTSCLHSQVLLMRKIRFSRVKE